MSNHLSKHKGEHTLAVLQKTVRTSESKKGMLVEIRAEENGGKKYTIGEHDLFADDLPTLHIIVLDSSGNGIAPNGTSIKFTGKAWIENVEKAVGICR
ncbi:MAG: hypothetical protein GW808_03080 [Sphingomonadales bacterium]|nr:hypothetical protein [Sphingomonadales bacterium]NCO98618.1 hypothetical protein [Sphingomonadales bacterium]NCQ08154.1 hypothetical protein [Sphingomonadales bacterium]NCQ50131.1 hypothetical protein [Sphingomonadales bacterium]